MKSHTPPASAKGATAPPSTNKPLDNAQSHWEKDVGPKILEAVNRLNSDPAYRKEISQKTR